MDFLIGQTINRYQIQEQIGEGGMALVFKAFDSRLESYVAVKVLQLAKQTTGTFFKRFEQEAKTLARLSHPNIVRILDYGDWQGNAYLVMQYLSGGTLKDRMNNGPVPYGDAAQMLLPIASALHYAHHLGIVHRDVKPTNILLTETSEPMLSDFGIARLLDSENTTHLTSTGVGMGTPSYMAPEQWEGQAMPQSDQYALGVVLYEMITGKKPYIGETPAAIMRKHILDPLPSARSIIPGLPKEVDAVLNRALAKKPQDRFPDMDVFMQSLRGLTQLQARKPVIASRPIHTGPIQDQQSQARKNTTPSKGIPIDPLQDRQSQARKAATPPKGTTTGPHQEAKPADQLLPLETQGTAPTSRRRYFVIALGTLLVLAVIGLAISFLSLGNPYPAAPVSPMTGNHTATSSAAAGTVVSAETLSANSPTAAAIAAATATLSTSPTLQPSASPTQQPAVTATFPPLANPAISPENANTISILKTFASLSTIVNSVAFSPDGKKLAAGTDNRKIYIWELDKPDSPLILEGHMGSINDVSFSADGTRIVSSSNDKTARIWDLRTGKEVAKLERDDKVISAVFFENDTRLGTASNGGYFQIQGSIWDLGNLQIQSQNQYLSFFKEMESINNPSFWLNQGRLFMPHWYSLDGNLLACENRDTIGAKTSPAHKEIDYLAVFDISKGSLVNLKKYNVPFDEKYTYRPTSFSPDSSLVIFIKKDQVNLMSVKTDVFVTKPGHQADIMDAKFSPDGTLLVTADYKGEILLWGIPQP